MIKHHTKAIAAGTQNDQQTQVARFRVPHKLSFNEAVFEYCKFRWHAFRFLKRRISDPLADYDLLDLDDY